MVEEQGVQPRAQILWGLCLELVRVESVKQVFTNFLTLPWEERKVSHIHQTFDVPYSGNL